MLRAATPADVPALHDFVCQLAAFEREPDAVKMSLAELHEALFGPRPRAEALLAVVDGVDQGFAIWFETFNTWTGRPALYLEDIFVAPAVRGRGIGGAIFAHLARLCVERGFERLEWSVLNWNSAAIGFYDKLGGLPKTDWTEYRLSGPALAAAAQQELADG